MASSSKASASAKRSKGNRVYGVTPAPHPSVLQDFESEDAASSVKVYNAPLLKSVQFCPEKLEFRQVLASLDPQAAAPATFYPLRYIRACPVFAEGRASLGEGLHLYQALVILQRAFTKLINGHHSKAETSRRLRQFVEHPNFSDCLRYYREHWHYTSGCPLFAPLLVALLCDFHEEHLSAGDYKKLVYDGKARVRVGMSAKTRQRVKAYMDEPVPLKSLAIPIPFDPLTREGQIILTIASRGTEGDQIRQPYTNIALRPDPTKRISDPKSSRVTSATPSSKTQKPLPPPAPSDDEDTSSEGSSHHGATARSSPQRFPVDNSPILADDEDEDDADNFPEELVIESPVPRRSIARAAKTKPLIPGLVMKTAAPAVKWERAPSFSERDPPVAEPPAKKRRTQAGITKSRVSTPVPQPDPPVPLRIQEGLPDYFDGDDTRTTGHQGFLTNPDFKPKAPFSNLTCKAVAQNPRAPKLPFLRPPKWQIADKMKNFGAFINSADTTFSLQGLSRYNYLASRHLQPSTSSTLPSPEALHSSDNCLTCLSRGIVCEGGSKTGGSCSHCDRTHHNCSSCLGIDEHRDRFQAIHNAVQGYPTGYSNALDAFREALDETAHVFSSFDSVLGDARKRLALRLQAVRDQGFDFNVVLSQWATDNPNYPLDFDMLAWLSTFFGWDSACNLSKHLVNPADAPRLEELLRSNASLFGDLNNAPSLSAPRVPPAATSTSKSTGSVPGASSKSRLRPAAAVPSNFHQDQEFHSPLPDSVTVADDEADVEEGTSRASVGRALLPEYDDSDEDDPDVEILDQAPIHFTQPSKTRT
ncbi:hypothetical protein FB446DRAFT_710004 [Lentinula raphanica]|nr:hypothetical protein FB446DRAFT_710004 [Lentinula raphanica]